VLRARAAPPGGDPDLRIYRIAPYGRLVGRSVGPLVLNPPRHPIGTLTSPGDFEHVDPTAKVVPWTRVDGTITGPGVAVRRTVAVAVNGRIAGLAIVDEHSEYHGLLAPQLFASGRNDVVAYLVVRTPRALRLVAVQPRS
jgi:hypothetical protein